MKTQLELFYVMLEMIYRANPADKLDISRFIILKRNTLEITQRLIARELQSKYYTYHISSYMIVLD